MKSKHIGVVALIVILVICGALLKDGSAKFPVLNSIVLNVMRPFKLLLILWRVELIVPRIFSLLSQICRKKMLP